MNNYVIAWQFRYTNCEIFTHSLNTLIVIFTYSVDKPFVMFTDSANKPIVIFTDNVDYIKLY